MEGAASEENPLKPGETIVMLHPLGVPIPLPPSLHPHRLGASGAAYISNILTVEEEQSLMREVRELPSSINASVAAYPISSYDMGRESILLHFRRAQHSSMTWLLTLTPDLPFEELDAAQRAPAAELGRHCARLRHARGVATGLVDGTAAEACSSLSVSL